MTVGNIGVSLGSIKEKSGRAAEERGSFEDRQVLTGGIWYHTCTEDHD